MEKRNLIYSSIILISLIILLTAFSRVFAPMYNFTPVLAIALFSSAFLKNRILAFLIPLSSIWISDLLITNYVYGASDGSFVWFYQGFYWQYLSYILVVLSGFLIFKKINVTRIAGGSLSSALLFFVLSNFGVWMSGLMYPITIEGLISCYAAGLPFFKGTFTGTLIYSALLFGSYYLVTIKVPYFKRKSAI